MDKLYKFYQNCGRAGNLEGIFVSNDSDIKELYGKVVYFYEVLGKHSEYALTMDEEHFEMLTDDQGFIEKFNKFGLESGINPANYIEDEED